jgi:hypothetical protein
MVCGEMVHGEMVNVEMVIRGNILNPTKETNSLREIKSLFRNNRVKISNTFLRQISFSFEVKGENNYNLIHVKRTLIAGGKI